METLRRQSPLIWIIEAFSVVSAGAFVVSAIGNAAIFWLVWRLNYFMIATPSDVLMSGFFVIGVFLTSLALGIILVATFYLLSFGFLAAVSIVYRHPIIIRARDSLNPFKSNLNTWIRAAGILGAGRLTAALFILALIISYAIFSNLLVGSEIFSNDTVDVGGRRLENFVGYDGGNYSYATGLKLVPSDDIERDCRGGAVLWMGSSSLIVGCLGRVQLMEKSDGLSFEPLSVRRTVRR